MRHSGPRPPSLVGELCRVFNAQRVALLCALSHGQVTIDGYQIPASAEFRWTEEQLRGRMAELCGRQARLYGGSRRS